VSLGTGPSYTVAAEAVTFQFDSSLEHIQLMYLFSTNVSNSAPDNSDFVYHGTVPVINNQITIIVSPEMLFTLSTLNSSRGSYPPPPPATPFPLPYSDNFDKYELFSEAAYFHGSSWSWQISQSIYSSNNVMIQQVTEPPVVWCTEKPCSLFNHRES